MRYIFRQKSGHAGQAPSDLAKRAAELGGKVLSQTDKMVYIEGSGELFRRLSDDAPDYVSTPEVRAHVPKPPRVSIKKRG